MPMRANTVLEVDHVSKLYSRSGGDSRARMGDIFWDTVRGRRRGVDKTRQREFWALKDVSFNLVRGEAIGVIGFNGAGKTTLLRLLMGQILPDAGEIRLAGTRAAMIDLSAGFHPNMSGRENIFLRSAMLGRNRSDVEASLDEIIDFTELGDAIDAPLYTYSSGMNMRLAFATTVFVDPDLLIIDEVLSVGDFRFRQKCLARIREMREHSAFVLVSHAMGDIERFCEQAIVLDRGQIVFRGAPKDAVAHYREMEDDRAVAIPQRTAPALGHFIENVDAVTDVKAEWLDDTGNPAEIFAHGRPLRWQLHARINKPIRNLTVGLPIFNDRDEMISGFSTRQAGIALKPDRDGCLSLTLNIPRLHLVPDAYRAVLVIRDGPEFLFRQEIPGFEVKDADDRPFWGSSLPEHDWTTKA